MEIVRIVRLTGKQEVDRPAQEAFCRSLLLLNVFSDPDRRHFRVFDECEAVRCSICHFRILLPFRRHFRFMQELFARLHLYIRSTKGGGQQP